MRTAPLPIAALVVGLLALPARAAEPLLAPQPLLDRETFWDNKDWDLCKANIPFFECPDADIQTTSKRREPILAGACRSPTVGAPMTRVQLATLVACLLGGAPLGAADKPVKVFILAGQSNMEGAGAVKADPKRNEGKGSLECLVNNAATAEKFKHLTDKNGAWVVRDDVWIHYLDRKGKLTVGFGSNAERIGPELGFGCVVGYAFDEPVLLIKLAWCGKSLAKDFRPPSSGGEVGPHCKEIVQRTKDVLGDLKDVQRAGG